MSGRARTAGWLLAGVLVQSATAPRAQTPPSPPPTEVYLVDLDPSGRVERVVNISNNADYDNQPSFTPDGRAVLFSSKRDGRQTDIYRYDIATAALTPLTRTPESEYSPLVAPDGQTFSVVRVEADNTQRLWRFDLDGTRPQLVLEQVKPVGYHVWIDPTHLGLFVLGATGAPNTLQIADTTTGKATQVDVNIGRGLQMRPGTRVLTYVSKTSTPWKIRQIDASTRALAADLASTLEGSEDFAWDRIDRSDVLFMASGSKLFVWTLENRTWREYADLAASGLQKITRIAIRPASAGRPRFALVAEGAGGGRD
jgi:dipeptidyl aminopeptidase/acylaminoacyl peptidase